MFNINDELLHVSEHEHEEEVPVQWGLSDVGWSVRAVPDSSLLHGSVSPAVSVRGERGEGAVTATGNIQSHLICEKTTDFIFPAGLSNIKSIWFVWQ